jgi:hypothetical protein
MDEVHHSTGITTSDRPDEKAGQRGLLPLALSYSLYKFVTRLRGAPLM